MHARVRPDTPGCTSHADTPPDDTTLQGAYERYHGRVFDLCYHYLGQVADAEDAVQETFARAARRLPTLTGDRGAYLLAVARNLCCNELRRRRRVVPVESIDREDRSIEAERGIVERAVLERLWDRLSPRERSLIHDTFAGFSQQEIAGRVGLSPNAVAVALLRARQRARTYASRALAAFVPLGLAWRWSQRAARRAATMPAEASSALALQIQQVGMVITAAIVGAMAVSPALAQPASLIGARTAVPASGAGLSADASAPVAAAGLGGGAAGSSERAAPPAASGPSQPASPVSVLDPIINPGRNAPQQEVQFTSITPSPHYSRDHTVFAAGFVGNGCTVTTQCSVLYESTDGGSSWHFTNVVGFAGGRILLPPSWPQDPTIFAMGATGLQRLGANGAFSPAVPVSAPASIAPDSRPGNAMVLIAANPLLVYSAATGLVTPGPALPAGMETPDDAAFVGDSQHIELTGQLATGANAVSGQYTGVVVQCVAATCTVVSSAPGVSSLHLVVSPAVATDGVVVAYSRATMLRSTDRGASFTASTLPIPSDTPTLATFPAQGAQSGLLVAGFGTQPVVMHVTSAGSAAPMPSAGLPSAMLVAFTALSDGRLLTATSSNVTLQWGLRCLVPGAGLWKASC